jgi:enolase
MSIIKKLIGREILDSRGNPTVSVTCELESGATGEASVPSGKSTGSLEALELRDGDMSRYAGLGVLKALENINLEINNNLQDKEFDQTTLDETLIRLDGTENKKRLGANAILGVSLAFAHASAREQGLELYKYFGALGNNSIFKISEPCLNIVNGGKHSDSGIDLQEFMIVPVLFDSFATKIEVAQKVVATLENILKNKNYKTDLGDEGGFAPALSSNEEALDFIVQAILDSGYTTDQIKIGIDSAASSFYKNGKYIFKVGGKREERNNIEMISWYENLVKEYQIIFLEDPFAEGDWEGFELINKTLGNKIKIVGDDLTVTNVKRINMAVERQAVNAVLIKVNQIGTITETIQAINLTKAQGWGCVVSHRSGETMDNTIADLAVGLGCDFIKSGAPTKPERLSKYERLIEIEKALKSLK